MKIKIELDLADIGGESIVFPYVKVGKYYGKLSIPFDTKNMAKEALAEMLRKDEEDEREEN